MDHLRGYDIGYEASWPYGDDSVVHEVMIREEDGKVLVSVEGTDDEGEFTASNCVSIDEFMDGDDDYLEKLVGEVLAYGRVYE